MRPDVMARLLFRRAIRRALPRSERSSSTPISHAPLRVLLADSSLQPSLSLRPQPPAFSWRPFRWRI